MPTIVHTGVVGTRHVPHRVRPPRTARIRGTSRSGTVSDIHSVRTSRNNQNDRRYIQKEQELFFIVPKNLSSMFPHARRLGPALLQGFKPACSPRMEYHDVLSWHPGQENLADYQSKHHVGSHHLAARPWYLHMRDSPRFLSRALRPSALKGCVGTLQNGYLRKVPLPRVPRGQSTSPAAAAATLLENPRDTGYLPTDYF